MWVEMAHVVVVLQWAESFLLQRYFLWVCSGQYSKVTMCFLLKIKSAVFLLEMFFLFYFVILNATSYMIYHVYFCCPQQGFFFQTMYQRWKFLKSSHCRPRFIQDLYISTENNWREERYLYFFFGRFLIDDSSIHGPIKDSATSFYFFSLFCKISEPTTYNLFQECFQQILFCMCVFIYLQYLTFLPNA